MMPFGRVHGHYAPEGRSKKVNAERKSGKEPPSYLSARFVRKTFSASTCASKGSKGEVPEVKE